MSFELETIQTVSWADKHEPKSLDEVIGHKLVKQKIQDSIGDNQIAHFILHGESGSGKTVLAKLIAKLFIQRFDEEASIRQYNASDDRGINFVRNEIMILVQSRGAAVFILDEADMMTKEAQNALRAILPEAKRRNKMFIFTCNHYDRIEEAIKSRCRSFSINRLSSKEIQTRIIEILKAENVVIKTEDEVNYIRSIITQSKGDMRQAIDSVQEAVNDNEINLNYYQPQHFVDDSKIDALLDVIMFQQSIDAINVDVNDLIFQDDKMRIPDFFDLVGNWLYNQFKEDHICKNVYLKCMMQMKDTDMNLYKSGSTVIQITGMLCGFLYIKLTECVADHGNPNEANLLL
jgi:DNA polymerase III delta prime subunit